jgi:hypothetical protein
MLLCNAVELHFMLLRNAVEPKNILLNGSNNIICSH